MAKQSNLNGNSAILKNGEYIMSKKQIEEFKKQNKIKFPINVINAESFKELLKESKDSITNIRR